MIDLLRAAKQRKKNTTPKTASTTRESHGNACPRTEARRHRQACVSGDSERRTFKAFGTWLREKKVPLKKDIGKMTKLIKRVIS